MYWEEQVVLYLWYELWFLVFRNFILPTFFFFFFAYRKFILFIYQVFLCFIKALLYVSRLRDFNKQKFYLTVKWLKMFSILEQIEITCDFSVTY